MLWLTATRIRRREERWRRPKQLNANDRDFLLSNRNRKSGYCAWQSCSGAKP